MSPEESFVRSVWLQVPSEEDVSWVRRVSQLPFKDEPLGDYGAIVKRMLDCGISEKEIARFARIVGYETAFGVAYLLADSSAGFETASNPESVTWQLFQVDPDTDAPIAPMYGMHEYMLGMDPSGREMRPPPQATEK